MNIIRQADHPADILGTSEVFKALSPEGRRRLFASGNACDLAAGVQLFARGDAGDACYIILSGVLEVTSVDPEGREIWLAALESGALIGEMAVLDGLPRSATITARHRARLIRIGRDAVLNALRAEPEAALALTMMLARRLRAADALMEEKAFVNLAGRLARLLLDQGAKPVTMPQGELARILGVSRERVNRTLAGWRDLGWVWTGKAGIKVLDPNRLAASIRTGNEVIAKSSRAR